MRGLWLGGGLVVVGVRGEGGLGLVRIRGSRCSRGSGDKGVYG